MIFQTISYSLLVPFNCVVVDIYHTLKALKCHEADVVFFVHQETTQNIDTQYT